jgi:predicted metal-dependent phosphoesterase TrpH
VKTAIAKGYDVIGVVDHDTIKGGLSVKKAAGKRILVIPGEEIRTRQGEIIVFFSDGKYSKNLVEICERAKDMNHFIVAPHPFDYLRSCLGGNVRSIKKYIDAVEVFNSRVIINRFNKMAGSFAEKNNIPKIAGSDSHFIEEIGNATVYLNCDKNIDSVLRHIKKNKIEFRGMKCSFYSHFKTNIVLPFQRIF